MATPSTSYPLSPVSSSAGSPQPNQTPQDERRRSKRDSTASATRRREEAATRYPSPPLGSSTGPTTNRTRNSIGIDPSLQIPPFNPNRVRDQRQQQQQQAPVPWAVDTRERERRTPPTNFNVPAVAPSGEPYRIPASHQTSHRPASAAIVPIPPFPSSSSSSYATATSPPSATPTSSSRARQSVGYLPTQPTSTSSAGPFPQLYTPHPLPRQKIYFGPYILLQTLGEGEFGKVKLGLHSERWGEEVAIKLIKRGNVDTVQRGEKVRREIEVLKAVRHPNIVRLYDVIETEKYIGIVLEYASGGELFDHILAHRYLKERDASRLFAQLISGVAYLHSKHVVHRDLKLENLLLDRNRNVIITDFGFANRFDTATDDLMATSCGSPCYAAPELVVQEGKYVGTAVDVWSCGVILYAMLAGYLPYDDDPANPEGDNINLLYKYIINTPLSFPDWITAEPRDLLLMMLVPDPARRCTIEDVTRHSWLRKFTAIFQKSVPELELQAQEAEIQKRQMLEAQRQFLINQQANAQAASQAQQMSRSQSSTTNTAAARHRSAVVPSTTTHRFPMESQLPASVPEEASRTRTTSTSRRSNFVPSTSPTTEVQSITAGASFARHAHARPASVPATSVPMAPSFSAPPDAPATSEDQIMAESEVVPVPTRPRRSSAKHSSSSTVTSQASDGEAERRKRSHRATVQVEYDAARTSSSKAKAPAPIDTDVGVAVTTAAEDVVMSPVQLPSTPTVEEEPAAEAEAVAAKALPSVPEAIVTPTPLPIDLLPRPTTPPLIPIPIPFPVTPPRTPAELSPDASTPKKRKSSGSPRDSDVLPPPPTIPKDTDVTPKAKKTTLATPAAPNPSPAPIESRPPSVASNATQPRHSKQPSIDRFSLRSLLSSSTSGDTAPAIRTTTVAERQKANEARRQADALAKEKTLDEVTNNRRKSRRQKALSLQPFRSGNAAAKIAKARADGGSIDPVSAMADGSRTRSSSSATATQGSMAPPPRPSTSGVRPIPTRSSTAASSSIASHETSTPSGKAKAVMDWFRRRSTRGFPGDDPIAIDFDRRGERASPTRAEPALSSGATGITEVPPPTSTPMARGPSVVVTDSTGLGEGSPGGVSAPSSRSASGAQSHLSQFSQTTGSTLATSVSTTASDAAPVTSRTVPFDENKLRIHQGALDKHALTSRSPPLVMVEVRDALWNMGIDVVQEGEFKLKCVRKSKKKVNTASTGLGLAGLKGSNQSAQTIGSAFSGSVDRRSGLPTSPVLQSSLTASPSSGFRAFFSRRNSTNANASPASGSPALPSPALSLSTLGHDDVLGSPLSPSMSQFGSPTLGGALQPSPIYGGPETTDTGDEVKFFTELTRVKALPGLYLVEVKRTRGGPWSFKFTYETLLENLNLGQA